MHLAAIVVACAAALCWNAGAAEAHFVHRCPPPMGKWPFDSEKFSGEWYVAARTLMTKFPDVKTTCHKLDYSTEMHGNETRVHIKIHMDKDDGKALTPEVLGRHGGRPGGGSMLQAVYRLSPTDKWLGVFTMSVLATDYDSWALVVSCKEKYFDKTDSFERFLVPHVWSRKPQLDATVMAVLKNILTGFDIDESSIIELDNSKC